MNDSQARLQRTLRAIERGERLESIDALLIRDVLQQPPPPKLSETVHANATSAVRGSDAYHVLLQLRRQKQQAAARHTAVQATAPVIPANASTVRSAAKSASASPEKKKPNAYVDKGAEDRQQQQREEAHKLQREASKVDAYRKEMRAALARTQRQLETSQLDVATAAHEMEELLAASQGVLSSSFLFEHNLTEFCHERSLEVITRVLQRFQHRFYALFFAEWVERTRELRREAQRRAVATIVRVVRGHHARTLRRVLQHEALKLRTQGRQVVELRVSYRHHQALKLQRVWRRYQWKQHDKSRLKRKQATVYLQQRWRNRKLQRNALISALLNVKQIRAAIRIQKRVRGMLTRRALARQKREQRRQAVAMELLARNASREAMVRWQLEHHGAAFVITRAMYPMLVRQRFRRLTKQLKRQKAGRVIAMNVMFWYKSGGVYRQRQEASIADKLRALVQQEQARLHAASIQIQKTIRRWWYQQKYETQRRRRKKLARIKRLQEKRERLLRKPDDSGGRGAAAAAMAIAKASAGLADVMKQARKKTPAQAPVDIPSNAASRIQRAYLRHRHRLHFQFKRWRQQACDVAAHVQKRRHAVIAIQRHVRGMLARRIARELRARHVLRQHITRWKWRRTSRRSQAARRIVRWLKHKHTQRLDKLWTLEKQRQVGMATLLQRWLRRTFFYAKRVARLLSIHRKRDEAQLLATQSLVICMQHFTDELILHSKRVQAFDESIKAHVKGLGLAPVKRLQKPPARARFPILPLVFLAVSGLKDSSKWVSMDIQDLLYTKVERSKMITLFKVANKLVVSSHSPQRRHHKPSETFSMTDVDLAMAKAAGASTSALVFTEFTETLQHLADMKLASVTLWWNKYDGQEARLLALLWQFVFRLPELSSLLSELTAYSERVVHAHTRVVQRLFLRQRQVAQGLLIKLQMLQQREMEKKKRAIIKVQANIRRMLARKIHRVQIQAQYDKYIDPEYGMPYWLNPKTGFSTWQKPWVLGDVDVASEAVPFPSSDKMLTVPCQGKSGCETCSDWYCYKCDEFFCGACEPTFHKTKDGEQSLHDMEQLRKCGLCKFQLASQSCDGCANAVEKKRTLAKKKKKPVDTNAPVEAQQDEEEADDDTALYCDVCFAFAHRRGALQDHRTTPLVELCADCQDDDAILDTQKAPLAPKPLARAVQWECTTDKKRVCGCCAWSLHPVEACGELVRLQLVTVQMKERAERQRREQEERERSDTELIRLRELRVTHERAAKKIQRFWLNSAPLIRARRVARALRVDKDAKWRQHKQDNLVQKTLKYQVKNALGLATALPSDTVAQRKLREMNALQRRQMGIRARAFGLLLPEYMQLGVPLPGLARVAIGTKYIDSSEDLRGWVLNRQTIRLKKLPPQEQRDRARRIRFRHHEPPLEDKAWLHELELWMRDPADTLLVDVDAKQRITEHTIPLAAAFTTSSTLVDARSKKADAVVEIGEPAEYAMFLVEFSMDPTRVVWVSHSLAERFAVWRKQKLREYRERRSLQHKSPDGSVVRTPELLAPSPETMDTLEETKNEEQAAQPAQYAEEALAYASTDPAAWGGSTGYGYDYSSYYAENAWAAGAASHPWAYNNDSQITATTYPYYNYSNAAVAPDETAYPAAAPQMVDSSNYFYAEDGNVAAWQTYYAAHPEMAASDNYSTQPSSGPYGYAGYETAAAYPSSQDAWGTDSDPSANSNPTAAYDAGSTYYAPQAAEVGPWEEVFDPATQQTYYYNRETQQTSWEYPNE